MYSGEVIALEEDERRRLLRHVDNNCTQRVRFTVRTLLHTGMRCAELSHMNRSWLRAHGDTDGPDWLNAGANTANRVNVPSREPCECKYCENQVLENVRRHSKLPNKGEPGYAETVAAVMSGRGEDARVMLEAIDHEELAARTDLEPDELVDAVQRYMKRQDGYWHPKSTNGVRSIPVAKAHEETWDLMVRHLDQYGEVQVRENALWRRVKKLNDELNFREDADITPHILRHSYGTMAIENGMDIEELQGILGHSSIQSTQVYVNLTGDKNAEAAVSAFDTV